VPLPYLRPSTVPRAAVHQAPAQGEVGHNRMCTIVDPALALSVHGPTSVPPSREGRDEGDSVEHRVLELIEEIRTLRAVSGMAGGLQSLPGDPRSSSCLPSTIWVPGRLSLPPAAVP
jgi:hypothetical protein